MTTTSVKSSIWSREVENYRDLGALRVDIDLREDHAPGMVESAEQVDPSLAVAGGAHRLAVHRDHPVHPSPPLSRAAQGGIGSLHPGPDRGLQRGPVHHGQDPPDRHRPGAPPDQPQPRADVRGQVGDPLADRRERTGPTHHRTHRDHQDRYERVAHPTLGPRSRHRGEGLQQPTPITINDHYRGAGAAVHLRCQVVAHGSDRRR